MNSNYKKLLAMLLLLPALGMLQGCKSDEGDRTIVEILTAGPDDDDDGIPNGKDNCRLVANNDQTDSDNDGTGDACELDFDGDGVLDDGAGDTKQVFTACADKQTTGGCDDNCPTVPNPGQENKFGGARGDACEDIDNDTVVDGLDNCPAVANTLQENNDAAEEAADAKQGDACDTDDDNDGIPDDGANDGDNIFTPCANGNSSTCDDNCPFTKNGEKDPMGPPDQPDSQVDTDNDGFGDACDADADGDGIPQDGDNSGDSADNRCMTGQTSACDDNCPLKPNADQSNLFGGSDDIQGDVCDDTDGDGLTDAEELARDPATDPEIADSDGDGRNDGDEVNGDPTSDPKNPDTDGDGLNDQEEIDLGTQPRKSDTDGDGRTDGEEVNGDPNSDPLKENSDEDELNDGEEITLGTDPELRDTDTDGVDDHEDECPLDGQNDSDLNSNGCNDADEISFP